MNIHQEIQQAKIDNILLGIKEPEALPKIISGDYPPVDPKDIWFHQGKFGTWMPHDIWDFSKQHKLIIFAGNMHEAEYWCKQYGHSLKCKNVSYLSNPTQLKGWRRDSYLIRIGTWRSRRTTNEALGFAINNFIEIDGRDEMDTIMDLKAEQAGKI